MVPVLRNVETMNYADIEKAIHYYGQKVNFMYAIIEYQLKSDNKEPTMRAMVEV